jgi:hypothetical protein
MFRRNHFTFECHRHTVFPFRHLSGSDVNHRAVFLHFILVDMQERPDSRVDSIRSYTYTSFFCNHRYGDLAVFAVSLFAIAGVVNQNG